MKHEEPLKAVLVPGLGFPVLASKPAMALLVLFSTACSPLEEPTNGEIVYALHPTTWYEDAGASYEVSPEGDRAVANHSAGHRLIDLDQGDEDATNPRLSVDEPYRAVFGARGRLTHLGLAEGEYGWYQDGQEGLEKVDLPLSIKAAPRWSPGGASVAYSVWGEEGFFVGPLTNPVHVQVDGVVTGVAWAPDETSVYAISLQQDGLSTLLRVDLKTSESHTIIDELDTHRSNTSPTISPDGRSLYLALAGLGAPDPASRHDPDADRDLDIHQIHLESGLVEPTVLLPGDDFRPVVAGGDLYWTHIDLVDQVVVIPASGGEAKVVVEDAQIPYWSPNGDEIAFTYGAWRIVDWALNLDAGVVGVDENCRPTSTPRPFVVGYHEDFTPVWSPDGEWIAYHSHRSDAPVDSYSAAGSTDDIYLRRASAPMDSEIRLTDFGVEVGNADWSPDGTKLVFNSWGRSDSPSVARPWMVTIDPEDGRPIHTGPLLLPDEFGGTSYSAWSPAGDRIAIIEERPGDAQALWLMNLDGSDPVQLTTFRSLTYGGVDWTPDGNRLVFSALAGERMQLFGISAEGGEPTQLSHDSGGLLHPQVSPDGRWIAATRVHRSIELRRKKI